MYLASLILQAIQQLPKSCFYATLWRLEDMSFYLFNSRGKWDSKFNGSNPEPRFFHYCREIKETEIKKWKKDNKGGGEFIQQEGKTWNRLQLVELQIGWVP